MHDEEKDSYSFKTNNEKEIENFVGIEAYSTSSIDGTGGAYKTTFKDFIVKEIDENGKILDIKEDLISPPFSPELKDKFTTFNLIKINMDAFEAIKKISRALKIPTSLINYSGLKDKFSISVQKISVKGNYIEKLKRLKIRDIFIRNIHPTKKPVKLGSHLGNNFTIIIRNIENTKNLRQIIEKLMIILGDFGFPNYFGLQRFGSYRPNSHTVGRFLIEGDYENAFKEYVMKIYSTESIESRKARSELRIEGNLEKAYNNFPNRLQYEKNMIHFLMKNPGDYQGAINTLPSDLIRLLISSFQSYLFNRMLSLRARKGFPLFTPIKGDVICILDDYNGNVTHVKYIYGESYDTYLSTALKLNRAAIVLPIIGSNTIMDEFPLMKSIYEEVIELEGLDENIFQDISTNGSEFKGSIRAMTAKPIDLKVLEITDDEFNLGKKKIKMEYSLQKGSYATMLIRELIK